jgi:hypothetical protein
VPFLLSFQLHFSDSSDAHENLRADTAMFGLSDIAGKKLSRFIQH